MLWGLPGLLLLLLLLVVRLLVRLVTGLLRASMVHLTLQHCSDTLPPEERTHASVRANGMTRLYILIGVTQRQILRHFRETDKCIMYK